eukprot:scaffold15643_cov104-Cylindrotheca_fusiformis.AAC.3
MEIHYIATGYGVTGFMWCELEWKRGDSHDDGVYYGRFSFRLKCCAFWYPSIWGESGGLMRGKKIQQSFVKVVRRLRHDLQ